MVIQEMSGETPARESGIPKKVLQKHG